MKFNYREDVERDNCIRCGYYSHRKCDIQSSVVSPFGGCDHFINWRRKDELDSRMDTATIEGNKVRVRGQVLPLSEYEIIADNLESVPDDDV